MRLEELYEAWNKGQAEFKREEGEVARTDQHFEGSPAHWGAVLDMCLASIPSK